MTFGARLRTRRLHESAVVSGHDGPVTERWVEQVRGIRTWVRDGQRAPHKPLLLLWMLGRVQAGRTGPVTFADLEVPVRGLLRDFGPPRTSYHPEFPFHHLTSDGLWTITDATGADARPLDTSVAKLRAAGAMGRLEPTFEDALVADPDLLVTVAHTLLDANFPASLHDDLAARTGLALESDTPIPIAGRDHGRARRDPAFRSAVLVAYEYRCAMCGFDGWLGGEAVGLEAAHVRWWNIGGPSTVDNGLALCALHHRLLDRGVLGLGEDGTVMVSQHFVGRTTSARTQVLQLAGAPLLPPQPGTAPVAGHHRGWHTAQVFRGPARSAA